MVKWNAFNRCKTRLSKDIGKIKSSNIQQKMTDHTILVAKSLREKGLLDISLAISGIGENKSRRWSNNLGIKTFNLQGKGCLGEKMKRQILFHKRNHIHKKIKNIIIIGTDLPDLCHIDIENAIQKLKKNDFILGPSNDGGYWLIAFSEKLLSTNLYLPFIDIKWSTDNVLQKTIKNLSSKNKFRYDFLVKKTDIDTIADIEKRELLI